MRLADHPSGLFTISVCVMSNFSKSRVLALQLLTKMCSVGRGHKQVNAIKVGILVHYWM